MAKKDRRWREKVTVLKEKPTPPEDIPVGAEGNRACYQQVLAKWVVPTGIESWVNVYALFRTVRRNTKKPSGIKITLRKYFWLPGKGWWLKQNYNINSEREAAVVLQALRSAFPQME